MKIAIIGAGPAGLMAAEKLAERNHEVHVYDRQKRAGSKFLVAGKGGFNLTNSVDQTSFLSVYSCEEIQHIIKDFDADDTRKWLESIRIPTYIGSSGKVFPMMGIKPADVLNNWLEKLTSLNVEFHFNERLIDFSNDEISLASGTLAFDKIVLALGGGSWKKTGSDGSWMTLLAQKGIETHQLLPMNVGIEIKWDEEMKKLQGQPIKNVELSSDHKSIKGELRITSYGLEGAPVYALTPEIERTNRIRINFKPGLNEEQWLSKLGGPKMNRNLIDRLKFSKVQMQLVRSYIDKETYLDKVLLSQKLQNFQLDVIGLRPIDEAISTRGGVSFNALNEDLSLKLFPNVYCIGEMVDWHAPTGGYLLQACFSMGYTVAQKIHNA